VIKRDDTNLRFDAVASDAHEQVWNRLAIACGADSIERIDASPRPEEAALD